MPEFFREVRELRQEGKLHQRLIGRVRIMFIIAALLLLAAAYNVYAHGANAGLALIFAAISFVPGFYVFARMSPIQWNEDTEIVEAGAMGSFGYAILALYVVFEVGARTVFTSFFPTSAIAYILALVFGMILGRAVGMTFEIHKVYQATHSA